MTAIWRDIVNAEAAAKNIPQPQSLWSYIAVGGDGFAPGAPARSGDIVKIEIDVQLLEPEPDAAV